MRLVLLRNALVSAMLICAAGPAFSESLYRDSAVMKLHGQRIGSLTRSFDRDQGQIKSEVRFQMKVKRFGELMEVNSLFTCIEDENGTVQSFRIVSSDSQVPLVISGRRAGDEFVIEKHQGANRATLRRPVPAGALSPWRAHLEDKGRQLVPGMVYNQRVFAASSEDDLVNAFSHEVTGTTSYTYQGKSLNAFVVVARAESTPTSPERHIIGPGGMLLRQELSADGIVFEKVEDLNQADSEVTDIIELLAVRVEGKIRFPRDARRLSIEITSSKALPGLKDTEYQAVRRTTAGTPVLSVRTVRRHPSQIFQSQPEQAYLEAEESIDPADPEIKKAAARITRGSPDALSKIRKINEWVFRSIKKKDYSVGYASASEVIRNLQGDCTEHSVLFVALARAAGVPARIVLGLAYMNDPQRGPSFVMHQWAEAFAGGWIPVDPSFGLLPADAARIVISRPVPGERREPDTALKEWGPHVTIKIVQPK